MTAPLTPERIAELRERFTEEGQPDNPISILDKVMVSEMLALLTLAETAQEQHAIVARVWQQLGSPTYEQLAGRSIHDLIHELKAVAETAAQARAEGWNAAIEAAHRYLRDGVHEVLGQPDSVGRRHSFYAVSEHRIDKIKHLGTRIPAPTAPAPSAEAKVVEAAWSASFAFEKGTLADLSASMVVLVDALRRLPPSGAP